MPRISLEGAGIRTRPQQPVQGLRGRQLLRTHGHGQGFAKLPCQFAQRLGDGLVKTARRFARRCREGNPERRTFGVPVQQLQQRIKPRGGIRLAGTRTTGDEHHPAAQAHFAGFTLPIGFALYWREQARKPFFLQRLLCRRPLLARTRAGQEVLCHAPLAIPETTQIKPTMTPNQRGHCSTPCGQQLRRGVHQPVFVPSRGGGGERGPPSAQFRQGLRLETEQLTAAVNQFLQGQATVSASFQLR